MNQSPENIVSGRPLHIVTQCPSTNDMLRSMHNKSPLNEGYTLLALDQTSGVGQNRAVWYSSAGESLALSVFLKPGFLMARELPQLSQTVGLACARYLSTLVPGVRIKWPNDLMVQNRKVGGILMESQVSGQKPLWVIAGIGINLNQENFPPHLPQAVSLRQLGCPVLDPRNEAQRLLGHLDVLYLRLRNKGFTQVLTEFSSYLMD